MAKIWTSLATLFVTLNLRSFVLCNCPEAFENHSSRCYHVFELAATWIEAKMYCKVFGADLAVIGSAYEERVIEGILTKYKTTVSSHSYWVNAADVLSESDWRWFVKDGATLPVQNYTHWYPGQPDNAATVEHCLDVELGLGLKWNDRPCSTLSSFICETGY